VGTERYCCTWWRTPHSVGLLWSSDRPVSVISTWQHTTLTTDIHAPRGIRHRNPLSERPQTHALESGTSKIGCQHCALFDISSLNRRYIKQQQNYEPTTLRNKHVSNSLNSFSYVGSDDNSPHSSTFQTLLCVHLC